MKQIILYLVLLLSSHSVLAKDTVTIYAASSMTNAVGDLVEAYNQQHDSHIVTVFGGSSSLARQIESGAPADVFLSANEKWVSYLVEKKLADIDKVSLIAGNQLVLIKPASSPTQSFKLDQKQEWNKVLDDSRIAVGNTDSVPVGIYAKETLTNLGVWSEVKSKLAQTNNVRSALALVERGESALGIVYKTDALLTDKVEMLQSFEPSLHGAIHYPLVQLNDKLSSKQLVDFIQSDEARSILNKYGFRTDMGNEKFAQ
ncbi:molybdate ABC transporter substrate-binding protein [Vibrio diazotrophicus]|uniref:molybdate ABC transporter substrate-binding protein n=1 Tax=Vibrio diazotrophicus TaxID=685 RepID=UPI000C9E9EF7|nr:molybdate ABC transporter substrate-binding protein [Vibrio diazotrophicus]PNH89429.1 molybdate ABC transporter substrate-binding protein [Vibrio diazotrophicus]